MITPDTSVAEIVRQCPTARRIFDKHGLHGCGGEFGPAEPVSFFASVHQVNLGLLLSELNDEMERPTSAYIYREVLQDYIYRRFFKAGIFIVITVGALWGAMNLLQIAMSGSFLKLDLLAGIHAHAHAMVYGWVGLFVMGFAYQSFPRFKLTKLWRPGLANLSFYFMLLGIAARIAAELLQPRTTGLGLGALAAALEITAITLFATVLYKTARSSMEPHNKYEKFIFGSVFWLVIGMVLSHLLFFAKATAATQSELVRRIATLDGPLRDVQLLGFAALIIAGVSQRFVPAVYGLKRPIRDNQSLIFLLMNFSLVVDIVCYVGLVLSGNAVFAFGLEAAYITMPVWAVLLARQLGVFSHPELPDRTFKFIRAAYGWLIFASFMIPLFLLYSRATGQLFAHSYMGAYRHAFTVGFISLMIMGVAARVVPILAGAESSQLSSLWGPFILINVACFGRVSLQIATDFIPRFAYSLIGLTGFIELGALAWWGAEMWKTMNLARTHRARVLGAPQIHPNSSGSEKPIQIAPAS